jgi:hypothetical protein
MVRWSWRLVRITAVAIASVELGAGAAAGPIPEDFTIKLERTACYGQCPVYSVTIDAKGNVAYDGARFVRVEGRQTDRVPVARVAALVATIERMGFFELRDRYRTIRNRDGSEAMVMDLPTAYITVTAAGRSKRIEDYFGAPDALKQLEREIDQAADTDRWIRAVPAGE